LADETDVHKIVVFGTDVEVDIHPTADRSSLVNNSGAARRQWRPANLIAACPQETPGCPPSKIAAGKPTPAVIGQFRPSTVVIGRPTEVLIGDPCPSQVGVSPINIRIGTHIWGGHTSI